MPPYNRAVAAALHGGRFTWDTAFAGVTKIGIGPLFKQRLAGAGIADFKTLVHQAAAVAAAPPGGAAADLAVGSFLAGITQNDYRGRCKSGYMVPPINYRAFAALLDIVDYARNCAPAVRPPPPAGMAQAAWDAQLNAVPPTLARTLLCGWYQGLDPNPAWQPWSTATPFCQPSGNRGTMHDDIADRATRCPCLTQPGCNADADCDWVPNGGCVPRGVRADHQRGFPDVAPYAATVVAAPPAAAAIPPGMAYVRMPSTQHYIRLANTHTGGATVVPAPAGVGAGIGAGAGPAGGIGAGGAGPAGGHGGAGPAGGLGGGSDDDDGYEQPDYDDDPPDDQGDSGNEDESDDEEIFMPRRPRTRLSTGALRRPPRRSARIAKLAKKRASCKSASTPKRKRGGRGGGSGKGKKRASCRSGSSSKKGKKRKSGRC